MRRNELNMPSQDYEKLYNVWKNMKARCYDKKSQRYYTYGARGIKVCPEWENDFRKFARWAFENGWNAKLSIERRDHNGDYCPENCCFITMAEQARNKTSNVLVTYEGETKCVAEWAEIIGMDAKTIYARIYRGITDSKIILYNGNLQNMSKEVFG